jgi:hypothetical protein
MGKNTKDSSLRAKKMVMEVINLLRYISREGYDKMGKCLAHNK